MSVTDCSYSAVSVEAEVSATLDGCTYPVRGRSEEVSLTYLVMIFEMPIAPGEAIELKIAGERVLADVVACERTEDGFETVCDVVEWRTRGYVHSLVLDMEPTFREG